MNQGMCVFFWGKPKENIVIYAFNRYVLRPYRCLSEFRLPPLIETVTFLPPLKGLLSVSHLVVELEQYSKWGTL